MPAAKLLNPPLTTILQPKYDIGKFAAKILIRKINDHTKFKEINFQPSLVIRNSTIKL